jgi:bifunctional non-homologous end joining protein LigD
MAKARTPDNPDSMFFDLDPGEGIDVLACAKVAFILKELLDELKLESFVKTSGKKGLHVVVPLDPKKTKFEQTKSFSRAVAGILQKNYPALVTARMNKEYRTNKVFINWSQNDASKTMVCVYSLRAMDKPSVSFPISWKDLDRRAKQRNSERLQVLAPDAVKLAEENEDFYHEMLDKKQRLPDTWA